MGPAYREYSEVPTVKARKARLHTAAVSAALLATVGAWPAGADGNFYLKPHLGVGLVQDNDFDRGGGAFPGADGDGQYDSGWAAGLGLGYRYANGWSAEIDWEYRTNDVDKVRFPGRPSIDDGDLASSIVYLNGYYSLGSPGARFRPYVGAGLGWVQEIDLDLGSTSYSSDGDIAWQLMGGVETALAAGWRMQGELRYSRVAGVDLDREGGRGRLTDLDYEAWTLGVGVIYDF
jgi:opacity protein-like surface antigen